MEPLVAIILGLILMAGIGWIAWMTALEIRRRNQIRRQKQASRDLRS